MFSLVVFLFYFSFFIFHFLMCPGPLHRKQLIMCHVNIRSLLAHNGDFSRLDLLKNFICGDYQIDIVALSETHVDNTIANDEIAIVGYTLFRYDVSRMRGGVALYIRDELQPAGLSRSAGIESLFVKLHCYKTSVVIGVCYRSPAQTAPERTLFLECLAQQLDSVLCSKDSCVYLGNRRFWPRRFWPPDLLAKFNPEILATAFLATDPGVFGHGDFGHENLATKKLRLQVKITSYDNKFR